MLLIVRVVGDKPLKFPSSFYVEIKFVQFTFVHVIGKPTRLLPIYVFPVFADFVMYIKLD